MLLLLYQLLCIVISVLVIQLRVIYTCTIWKKVWDTITPTGTCMTLHFKYIYFNMNLVSPLHIAIIASIILGRLSTRFLSVSVLPVHSVEHLWGLTRNLRSSLSQRCLMELRSGLSGSVKFIHTKLIHTCLYTEAKHRNVICQPTDQDSTAPESSGSMLYTTPSNAWHCTWWCKGYMQLKSIPWSSCCTFLEPITVPFFYSLSELFFDAPPHHTTHTHKCL